MCRGSGTVQLAVDTKSTAHTKVALKSVVLTKENFEHISAEIYMMHTMRHDNIVHCLRVYVWQTQLWVP